MKNNGSFSLILFLTVVMVVISIPQFAYAQTVENEIIENTLETVEKATAGISEITESLNNASELIERSTQNTTESAANNATQQATQIEDIATNMGNATESAIAGVGETPEPSVGGTETAETNLTKDAREKIEEAKSDAETAVTNATEDAREKIEEAMSDRESTIAGTPDTTPPAPAQEAEQQQATPPAPAQESTEKGGNVLDQIWGQITNLFK